MTEDRGKQQSASADCIAGSAYDDKILLADVEQTKHLLVYDLGLGDSDQAFHCKWQDKNQEFMQVYSSRPGTP